MATWTTPRDWTDGEAPTKAIMDVHIRDNQLVQSVHTHSGAAGEGSADITPDTVTFTDEPSSPSAPGTGLTVIYGLNGTLYQRAGAAGSAEELSVVGHTHACSQVADSGGETSDEGGSYPSWTDSSTSYTTRETRSLAATSADNCITFMGSGFMKDNGGIGGGTTIYIRLTVDAVQKIEHSEPILSGSSARLTATYVMASPSTIAVDYDLDEKNADGTTNVDWDTPGGLSAYSEVTDA